MLLVGLGPSARAHPEGAAGVAPAPPTIGGYVEAFYQWNFNRPGNGITHARGFDNRHNSFTLSNVALGLGWDHDDVVGRAMFQVGHTPSTYYLAEPVSPGAGLTNRSDAELWRFVQQAYAGYRFGLGRGLTVAAGLFLSPTGVESMAVYENWNWSRSNLFVGLPFYHTGLRATYATSDRWAFSLAAYNGWNSVVDNNGQKSVAVQGVYSGAGLVLALLYFGGGERPRGAPEGAPWRHLFDAHLTVHTTPVFSFSAHANAGFESNRFGVSRWAAGALYVRLRVAAPLYFAGRGDLFAEHVPENELGRGAPIFWPASWVSSGTLTADYRPGERISFRLEYRHDYAAGDMYFGGDVLGDGVATPFVPNRRAQDTLTIGATSWF